MRALVALIRQWEFSLSALLALVAGFSAAYLFQVGDFGLSFLCAYTWAGFIWNCLGFGRVGTVHLRLAEQGAESEEG